ncbi:cobyric acid synthase [Salmonella enterica subsp. enterica]|uniref:Cobyric acid synthase n=1 Tax=Salmonella enterica I TaxID=59201 RepID=A0A379WS19_SALET|nr:cobyric acid synthase [Salmonella enterica subsp. enterica]
MLDGESGDQLWMRLVTMTIKPRLREQILAVYNSLAQEYDVIVLEGARKPGGINLRDRDIVNMGMAEMAQCPVILVADIDRGGVFAAIYGTLALLHKTGA